MIPPASLVAHYICILLMGPAVCSICVILTLNNILSYQSIGSIMLKFDHSNNRTATRTLWQSLWHRVLLPILGLLLGVLDTGIVVSRCCRPYSHCQAPHSALPDWAVCAPPGLLSAWGSVRGTAWSPALVIHNI